jgi:hypothetical protein
MSELLKGNFKVAKEVMVEQQGQSIEDRFEREALKKLGGSIAFVSKKKVMWGDEPAKDDTKK